MLFLISTKKACVCFVFATKINPKVPDISVSACHVNCKHPLKSLSSFFSGERRGSSLTKAMGRSTASGLWMRKCPNVQTRSRFVWKNSIKLLAKWLGPVTFVQMWLFEMKHLNVFVAFFATGEYTNPLNHFEKYYDYYDKYDRVSRVGCGLIYEKQPHGISSCSGITFFMLCVWKKHPETRPIFRIRKKNRVFF